MKYLSVAITALSVLLISCNTNTASTKHSEASPEATTGQISGQSGVKDDVSKPNIVQVAAGSKDHSSLVKAVQAAGLVDALSNAGPFTVFAPTNAAFEKLPEGTLEDLLKPENKEKLANILGYHTYIGVLDGVLLQDGYEYDMVYGGKIKITKKDNKTFVNNNEIVASIKTSNGIIHVMNEVLMPAAN